MKKEIKQRAIILRRSGFSFREISETLRISKSTASLWCEGEVLNKKAKIRIKSLGDIGREKGKITAMKKREKQLMLIDKECQVLNDKVYDINDYKLFLALLYWGEGGKTKNRFRFTNSDSEMVKSFLFLLRKAFVIDEKKLYARIHLHEYHNREEMIDFWSGIIGIEKNKFSIYNKPHTGINKKPGYKGCITVSYGDSRVFKEIFIIINRFIKKN